MKNRKFLIALGTSISIMLIALSMSGCTGMRINANRSAMANVRPDMSVEEVSKIMGAPDRTELYRGKDNEPILVFLYMTEHPHGTWNENNYTPFVFINDRLQGWGWSNLESVGKRYEFVIKQR